MASNINHKLKHSTSTKCSTVILQNNKIASTTTTRKKLTCMVRLTPSLPLRATPVKFTINNWKYNYTNSHKKKKKTLKYKLSQDSNTPKGALPHYANPVFNFYHSFKTKLCSELSHTTKLPYLPLFLQGIRHLLNYYFFHSRTNSFKRISTYPYYSFN